MFTLLKLSRLICIVFLSISTIYVNAGDKLKVGFIYASPVGDIGWSAELDEARKTMEEEFGDKIETSFVENIPEGQDAARIMNQMVAKGADVMVLGSFGYMNDGLRLAAQHKDVVFLHASGYKQAKNFGTFQAKNYEGAYIAGMASGYVAKNNTLGVVAAYAIPEVIGIINAYTLGAKSINPDIKVKVVWLNSWFNPSKAQEAARSLVAQNVDVLFSLYQDTPSVVSVAEEKGVYVVNLSSDMSKYAPTKLLASLQLDWSYHFNATIQSVLDGTYKSEAYWSGFHDGAITMVSLNKDLNDEQVEILGKTIIQIADGYFHPFTGPIFDQSGSVKVKQGAVLEDKMILGINWLVDGVEGSLPKN